MNEYRALLKWATIFAVSWALLKLTAPASGQHLAEVLLTVNYQDQTDALSPGSWTLHARTTDFGLAAINVRLHADQSRGVLNRAPRGYAYGLLPAGFDMYPAWNQQGVELRFAQQEQINIPEQYRVRLYGVGSVANGTETSLLTPPGPYSPADNYPWATAEPLPGWTTAVLLASGTFGSASAPFLDPVQSRPAVFTALPDNTSAGLPGWYGKTTAATLNAMSISNLMGLAADLNGDNRVDAADYTLWRDAGGASVGYQRWQQAYGSPFGPVIAVPEPSDSVQIFLMGLVLGFSIGLPVGRFR